MTNKVYNYHILALILGILYLAAYFFSGYLYETLWILSLLPLMVFGIGFLVFFILTIKQKNKFGILTGILVLGTVFSTELLGSELFKSKKVLEASLKDDLSEVRLTLREDKTFEIVSQTLFTEQIFKGNYQLFGSKLIFKDKPYADDFIPDTLTIVEDKIICRFDKNGYAVTDFATYFDIKRNELKNPSGQ